MQNATKADNVLRYQRDTSKQTIVHKQWQREIWNLNAREHEIKTEESFIYPEFLLSLTAFSQLSIEEAIS